MPRIHGILETAIYAKDLTRAAEFYRRLFDLGVLLESERLIVLNVADRSVLLLFLEGATHEPFVTPGGVIPGHSGTISGHLAFSIAADDLSNWIGRLDAEGIALESRVTWTGGTESLYFRDPDDNLVELVTPGLWLVY